MHENIEFRSIVDIFCDKNMFKSPWNIIFNRKSGCLMRYLFVSWFFLCFFCTQCIMSNLLKKCLCMFGTVGVTGRFGPISIRTPGFFRSYSLSVRSFRPGSFRLDFRVGSFRPDFGGSFRPTLHYIVSR